VGTRHRRIRARSATGHVAAAATEKPALQLAHRPKRPAQPAFSQKAPRPSQPNLSPPPDAPEPSGEQFHAPTSDHDLVLATSGAGGMVSFTVLLEASRRAATTASTSTSSAEAPSTSRGCTSSSASEAAAPSAPFEITFLDVGVRAYVFT
jgi:hypothetical protein